MLNICSSSSNTDKIHVDRVCLTSGFQTVFDQTHTLLHMTNTHNTHCDPEGCSSSDSGLHSGRGFVRGGAWRATSPPCFLRWRVCETRGTGRNLFINKMIVPFTEVFLHRYIQTQSVDIYRHFCKMPLNKYQFFIDSFLIAKNKPTCTNPSVFSKCGCRL